MLVTFTTKAYADITMFGEHALALLKMMGHSATVPGAIRAEDVAAALERLQSAVAAAHNPPGETAQDADAPVSVAHRALPLINLLAAAAKDNTFVSWK